MTPLKESSLWKYPVWMRVGVVPCAATMLLLFWSAGWPKSGRALIFASTILIVLVVAEVLLKRIEVSATEVRMRNLLGRLKVLRLEDIGELRYSHGSQLMIYGVPGCTIRVPYLLGNRDQIATAVVRALEARGTKIRTWD